MVEVKMKIVTFESLAAHESLTGSQLHTFCETNGLQSKLICNTNKSIFLDEISDLTEKCAYGDFIIINIEAHGLVDKSGIKLTDSSICWSELSESLVCLNQKIGMRLILLFSTCYGAYFYEVVSLSKGCPYYKFFGPDSTIHPDKILETNKAVISALKQDDNLSLIVEEKNKYFIHSDVKYIYFDATDLFRKAYEKYIEESLSIESVKQRIANYEPLFKRYAEISRHNGHFMQTEMFFKKMYGDGLFEKRGMESKFIEMQERFLMINDRSFDIYEMIDFTFDSIIYKSNFEKHKSNWETFRDNLNGSDGVKQVKS
jgi:hypothetical protein